MQTQFYPRTNTSQWDCIRVTPRRFFRLLGRSRPAKVVMLFRPPVRFAILGARSLGRPQGASGSVLIARLQDGQRSGGSRAADPMAGLGAGEGSRGKRSGGAAGKVDRGLGGWAEASGIMTKRPLRCRRGLCRLCSGASSRHQEAGEPVVVPFLCR